MVRETPERNEMSICFKGTQGSHMTVEPISEDESSVYITIESARIIRYGIKDKIESLFAYVCTISIIVSKIWRISFLG